MSKFNTPRARPVGRGPITSEPVASGRTFEGGPGFARDNKSELFLLAVSNMVGENTFYEPASGRDSRYTQLIHQVAVAHPQWTADFLRWLRSEANMRTASLVGAAEAVKARLDAGLGAPESCSSDGCRSEGRYTDADGAWWCAAHRRSLSVHRAQPSSRRIIDSVLQRPDEPGELIAYWASRYGRTIPMPVKRGVADAAKRLYNERSLLKYDTDSHGFRFADVIELVHPAAVHPEIKGTWQEDLFGHALDRRHQRQDIALNRQRLPMLVANADLRARVARGEYEALLDPETLREAGMTWEDALSLAGSNLDKAKLWTALIPSMGYMALLRNLRNFDEAGVSDEVAEKVAKRLAHPAQVARSRQLPFRFLAAYEQVPSLRWGHALDKALQESLANVPALPGRSLILVDTSGSMGSSLSARSKMSPGKAAAVFGVALAAKGEQVDLVGFASGVFRHAVPQGGSVIREANRFIQRSGEVGHGTDIHGAVRASYQGHDRVFIISDMQTISGPYGGGVADMVPARVPVYGFNLGGYKHAAFSTGAGNRHEFGGLTDATFRMVPLLETGRNAGWPWTEQS